MIQTSFYNTNKCQITVENGMLVLASPYIYQLVEAVKGLPYTERRYDGTRKVWMVDPKHGQKLVSWIEIYANEKLSLPNTQIAPSKPVMRLLEIRYLGTCKTRDDGSVSAFAMIGKDWSAIFPEAVLRKWFDNESTPQEPTETMTLYQILGIKKTVTGEEIRTAYRRMARQWHPDICKEANATEVFLRIQEAYELLNDSSKRARYDAGLALQKIYEKQLARETKKQQVMQVAQYRAPLRCGLVMVEGVEKMGRIEVTSILAWEDIVKNGKTLVVSWAMGAKEPTEVWA